MVKFVKNKHPKIKDTGYSPLHLATEKGFLSIAECFIGIKNGTKKQKMCLKTDKQGKTPLHLAASNGNLPLVKLFVENSKEKCPKDQFGLTPMHSAAEGGHLSILKFLISHSKEKNPQDEYGFTPLHRAAEKGHLEIVKYILKYSEDKNPKNSNNWTPLHEAAFNGHLQIVKHIMENITDLKDINPASNGKWTPMKYAAYKGHAKIVDFIKKAISARNSNKNRAPKKSSTLIQNGSQDKCKFCYSKHLSFDDNSCEIYYIFVKKNHNGYECKLCTYKTPSDKNIQILLKHNSSLSKNSLDKK